MNKKNEVKEVSIEEFIDTLRRLPKHEHRERWIRWLSDYDKPGPFNRRAGENHTAKFAYNNLAYPEMLLWLIEAAGIEKGLIELAESESDQFTNMRRKSAAIRKRVPWEVLERALWMSKDASLANEKRAGQLTAKMARKISQDWTQYDILYDHDPSNKNVGRVVSWFGDEPKENYKRGTLLSFIDIAILRQNSDDVVVLIEIEETNDTPKTLLGDVFGVLMGDHIRFRQRDLSIGKDTLLVVLGQNEGVNKQHIDHIRGKVEKVKSELGTNNSILGEIIIQTFSNEDELSTILTSILKNVL